jgi:glycosyltransferase involved in cell wall biosynthesis
MGMESNRVFVSNNTLDTARLSRLEDLDPSSLARTRSSLGLGSDPVLLFVGRLLDYKRVDVFLDAVSMLRQQQRAIRAVVVGDGPERATLEARFGHREEITFLGEIYDEKELAKLFSVATLLVIPGRIGLTCIHGFCYGVPSITSREGSVNQSPEYDYLVHGANSWLVDEPDPEHFATALDYILSHQSVISGLRKGARESANELTMEHMVDQYAAAIRRAVRSDG